MSAPQPSSPGDICPARSIFRSNRSSSELRTWTCTCRSCSSAKARARCAQTLLAATVGDPMVLEGGTDAWAKAGNPVVRTTAARWALERQVRLVAGLLVALGTVLGLVICTGGSSCLSSSAAGSLLRGSAAFVPWASFLPGSLGTAQDGHTAQPRSPPPD